MVTKQYFSRPSVHFHHEATLKEHLLSILKSFSIDTLRLRDKVGKATVMSGELKIIK